MQARLGSMRRKATRQTGVRIKRNIEYSREPPLSMAA